VKLADNLDEKRKLYLSIPRKGKYRCVILLSLHGFILLLPGTEIYTTVHLHKMRPGILYQ
jgi:hypothetical protein